MLNGTQIHIQRVKAIRQMPTFEKTARTFPPNSRIAKSARSMMIRIECTADPVTMSMISGSRAYTTNTKTAVR
jgi:flagellar basal body rod protein FlgC